MNLSSIPVLMYHSIKYKRRSNWVYPHITLLLHDFYRHLRFFYLNRIKTHFLDEMYEHISGKRKLNPNSTILTFDDGYLDNFVFVYPLLKKFKLKATIWVNPDFVDNNDHVIRPTIEDYWNGKLSLEELNSYDGFLNWEEMRVMEKSGYVEIQSHTLTHTKYPVSDKIIDFVSPDTKIDWLYWNLYPKDKPFYLTEPHFKIPLGYPIYESEKGNIALKYEEDGSLSNALVSFVKEKGNEEFFKKNSWKKELYNFANEFKAKNKVNYKSETKAEYVKRIKYELSESKRIIEANLGKIVNHVCWPFGGKNFETVELSKKIGYLTSSGSDEKNYYNKKNFQQINRISIDNSKYQNFLFPIYALYKVLSYKF